MLISDNAIIIPARLFFALSVHVHGITMDELMLKYVNNRLVPLPSTRFVINRFNQ